MEIKSNVVPCPNGHYYNASIHSACPICGGVAAAAAAGAGSAVGSFIPTENPGTGGSATGSFIPTENPLAGGGTNPGNFIPTEDPRNAGFGGGSATFPPTETPLAGGMGPTNPSDPWNAPGSVVNPFQVQTQIGGGIASSGQVNPVVGWLVCVDGPVRGTDFRIHTGYNYIGRERGDIHIQGDNQISREKHAMVAYHNANRLFYVGPAEGRNIIEVNGEPIFNAVKLNAYDIITVGTTRLIFVPLCGEHFNWEQPTERK